MTRLLSILLFCALGCGAQQIPPFPQPVALSNLLANANTNAMSAAQLAVYQKLEASLTNAPSRMRDGTPNTNSARVNVAWNFGNAADSHIEIFSTVDFTNWHREWQGNATNTHTTLPALDPRKFYIAGLFANRTN